MYLLSCLYTSDRRGITYSLHKQKSNISYTGLDEKDRYQNLKTANQQLTIKSKLNSIVLLYTIVTLSICIITFSFWINRMKTIQLSTLKHLVMKEKNLLENEIRTNKLLELQIKMQNIILLNIEQHRHNAFKRPENNNNSLSPIQNYTFHEELIACMDLEYNDISQRLVNTHPNLTERDILISCLLLANFDTGMIASVLDVKIESITKHRYRLRTRLELNNLENLVEYLRNF